jgi:hypothetical protein
MYRNPEIAHLLATGTFLFLFFFIVLFIYIMQTKILCLAAQLRMAQYKYNA